LEEEVVNMKITMMVDGHTTGDYSLERGKAFLRKLQNTNLIKDDETEQLAKIEFLTENSRVTVYPIVAGG
jgi:hypothetical protein